MHRIILADNQAIFRSGAARVLALEEDLRIVAQCDDLLRLFQAIEGQHGSIALVSLSLRPEMKDLLARTKASGCKLILIVENNESVPDETAMLLDGVLYRNVDATDLVDCVRRVGRGQRVVQRTNVTTMPAADSVGARVRDRLTPKEIQIVALIVQGCKNKEIALQLGTKEQVIKNYLRGIYDKVGVSDRLELALFTIHHRVLAEAAAKAGQMIQMKTA